MTLSIRRARAADAPELGRIAYEAFRAIAERHGFAPDLPSPAVGVGMAAGMIADPQTFDVVAELDGAPIGSNFLSERDAIAGIGPITVDPARQDGGAGARLMRAVLERVEERGFVGVRLVQAAYHARSLALYSRLGFEARELLACMQGPPLATRTVGFEVRPAGEGDLAPCDALCRRVHGHDRAGELALAVSHGEARVVERGGRVAGYATGLGFFAHAVAETTEDLQALIADAQNFSGPGFLVPTRNGALLRWCLGRGLRITQTMTLMSRGLYGQPEGAWLPSIFY